MPIGIIINALSVSVGGVIGMLFGSKVPEKIKTELIQIFGKGGQGSTAEERAMPDFFHGFGNDDGFQRSTAFQYAL